MTTAVAIAVVMLILVVMNVWVHLGPGQVHVVTGPLAALLLLVLARAAGLTWEELGLGHQTLVRGLQAGLVAAVAVGIGYAVGVAIPLTRGAFRDTRYRLGLRTVLYTALVAIPLGTVLFEEVAFRGVVWGLLSRDVGVPTATILSACLFGIWHVLPALDLARTHTATAVKGPWTVAVARRRVTVTVLATIAFTTIAGIIFAELRRRTGSLVAPIGLHWATNGLGVLAAARVWAISPGEAAILEEAAPMAPVEGPLWQRIVRRLRS